MILSWKSELRFGWLRDRDWLGLRADELRWASWHDDRESDCETGDYHSSLADRSRSTTICGMARQSRRATANSIWGTDW